MRKKTKIAVAMSGGVDSTMAAALLVEAGFEVVGLTMLLAAAGGEAPSGPASADAAREAAARLGITHFIGDFRRAFERTVVGRFCREYARGRTPNPCLLCNRSVKFGLLFRKALSLGADFLATGHYARVGPARSGGHIALKKGRDKSKDQSYFLYMLGQDRLARLIFPLGGLLKTQVRAEARRRGLRASERPESQEICFIPHGDYARFLAPRIPRAFRPGPILGPDGEVLGKHRGIARYTVGQRRGLGVAAARPLYVLGVDADRSAVRVGPEEALGCRRLAACDVHWVSGMAPPAPLRCRARIRYRHPEAAAVVRPLSGRRVQVEFGEPQRAAAPGQAVVFYRGDEVLGGATIDAALD